MRRFVILVIMVLPLLLGAGCDVTSPRVNDVVVDKIAFGSDFEDPGQHLFVYTINPDGSDLTKIGELGIASFKWSPDGTRIAFIGPDGELWIADAEGMNASRVELANMERLQPWIGYTLSWSPDGTEIVASCVFYLSADDYITELCTINVETGVVEKLTDAPDDYKYAPSWSPDGSQITFTVPGPPDSIYLIDPDGSNQRLLATVPQLAGPTSWSPDGKQTMYAARGEEGCGDDVYLDDIYLMDVEQGTSVNLTNSPDMDDQAPVWSPDGTRIAFSSQKRMGTEQIYVMDADGSNVVQLTDGKDEKLNFYWPSWSPDGKRIAFTGELVRLGPESEQWCGIFVMDIESHSMTEFIGSKDADYGPPVWSPR